MPRSTVGHVWKLRHRRAWDLTGIESDAHRQTIQDALNACDYPFMEIRRKTGKRIPVTVSDLTRYSKALTEGKGHAHVEGENGEVGHLLGAQEDPTVRAHDGEHPVEDVRYAALGLYWLPTPQHPAGRVEIEKSIMDNRPLAMEVFLAEAAHAVDYGAMNDAQREAIWSRFHGNPGDHTHPVGHTDWFEEKGEMDYYDWAGERFMGLFMAAFAPVLPRPLESRQPWTHHYDKADIAATREILL